jgi:hypothetical protein
MKNKFRVGEKVRIISKEELTKFYNKGNFAVTTGMIKYSGKDFQITKVRPTGIKDCIVYYLKDVENYYWYEELLKRASDQLEFNFEG